MSQKDFLQFHITADAIAEIVGRARPKIINWCLTTAAKDDDISITRLLLSSVNVVKSVHAHHGSAHQKRENMITDPKTILGG